MAEHKLANFIEIDGEKYIFPKRCYTGMIIESTTLKTEQEVIDFYGGAHWQPIIDFTYGINPEGNEVAGTYHEEELPNVRGSVGNVQGSTGVTTRTGALKQVGLGGDAAWTGNTRAVFVVNLNLAEGQTNANGSIKSTSVYKDGGRVFPRAMKVYKWLCIDEGSL